MIRVRAAFGLAWAAVWLTGASSLHAASLQISPVTVELAPQERGAVMTLANSGDTPLHGQVRVYQWEQRDGQDILTPTPELQASPPLLRIAPGAEQIVRLVRTDEAPAAAERSYRLLIDEIPEESASDTSGIRLRMRYSVPVFVGPGLGAGAAPQLEWRLMPGERNWRLRVDNRGTRRARLNSVVLLAPDGTQRSLEQGLLGYALAGSHRIWDLDIPASQTLAPGQRIQAVVNARPVTVPVQATGTGGNAHRAAF